MQVEDVPAVVVGRAVEVVFPIVTLISSTIRAGRRAGRNRAAVGIVLLA